MLWVSKAAQAGSISRVLRYAASSRAGPWKYTAFRSVVQRYAITASVHHTVLEAVSLVKATDGARPCVGDVSCYAIYYFEVFFYKKLKNVSCEYYHVNG